MVTNGFGNKSFMHPMRRLSMHSWGLQKHFQFKEGRKGRVRGGGRLFVLFPHSQSVPIRFLKLFPQDIPNNTSDLPPYALPNVQLSCIYINWKGGWNVRICNWRSKAELQMVSAKTVAKTFVIGQINMTLFHKKEKVVSTTPNWFCWQFFVDFNSWFNSLRSSPGQLLTG